MTNFQAKLDGTTLNLSDYLNAIKYVLDETFDHQVWVRAELRNVSTKGGHYYFELAEKDDSNRIVASCRATLWRSHASKILHFERTTGQPLKAGLSILIKGSISFHAQYGLSFNITDIDPSHTLGVLAMQYQAMLKKLQDNGLIDLNKVLPTPFDLEHVLVISPESAAGLGDFKKEADRLAHAKACQFYYYHATFQGNHAPQEIRQAITMSMNGFFEQYRRHPDLLVVIRGGGAVGDLAYLNDYELAALLAEQPIPVWVGIGHERDTVLLDEVAHTRFDTPSKVVHAIENLLKNRWLGAKTLMNDIQSNAIHELNRCKQRTELTLSTLKHHAHQKTAIARINADMLYQRIQAQSKNTLDVAKHRCQHLQSLILIQHPQRTLQKGYAIVRQDHKPISSANVIGNVEIEFQDGKVNASILK